MTNFEKIAKSDLHEMAKMICFLSHDCVNCPINDGDEIPLHGSLQRCWRDMEIWLWEKEDEAFWGTWRGME